MGVQFVEVVVQTLADLTHNIVLRALKEQNNKRSIYEVDLILKNPNKRSMVLL